jgi:hypothetical protein
MPLYTGKIYQCQTMTRNILEGRLLGSIEVLHQQLLREAEQNHGPITMAARSKA